MNNKNTIVKKLLLLPSALAVFSLIYPYIAVISIWVNTVVKGSPVETGRAESCGAFPINDSAYGVAIVLFLQLFVIVPIWLGLMKGAIYLIFSQWVNYLGVGAWFILIANVSLFCEPGGNPDNVFIPTIAIFISFSLSIFIFYLMPRLKKVLELNPHVFDFQNMKYYALGNVVRLDGKDSNTVSYLAVSGGMIGIAVAKIYTPDSGLFSILPYILWMFLGYIFIGFFALSSLFFMIIIYKQNRKTGRKMLVSELCQDKSN